MQISNPTQIIDWEIKKFLRAILAIQLAMLGITGMNAIGLAIPVITQLVGFIYLAFVPGILILRVLKVHKLGTIEVILYSTGLSIVFTLLLGFLMNALLPIIGTAKPLSPLPLVIGMSIVVLLLSALSYKTDRNFSSPTHLNLKGILSPAALFLILIPLLSLLGVYLVNAYENSSILLLIIGLVAVTAGLVAFDKFIPKRLFPLALLSISIALLFSHSLVGSYLSGFRDTHLDYYFYNETMTNSFWNWLSPLQVGTGTMLSVTILPTIYSRLLNIEGVLIFKIIYPLLFALVPLGLYQAYGRVVSNKVAFLSVFFFMATRTFFVDLVFLPHQQLAELFLVLVILLVVRSEMNTISRRAFLIAFSAGMIVSHYGLSIMYMLLSLLVLFGVYIVKGGRNRLLGINSAVLFVVMLLAWHIYIGGGITFNSVVNVGNSLYQSIFTELLSPHARQAVEMIFFGGPALPLHQVNRIVQYIMLLFISVGIIDLIPKLRGKKFSEYALFSIASFAVWIFCIFVPYFSNQLNTVRTYHITLLFLAPFSILGGGIVFRLILKALSHIRLRVSSKGQNIQSLTEHQGAFKAVSIILIIYLLFNSGFIYEIANERPSSIALSMETVNKYSDNSHKTFFYFSYTREQDVVSTRWLSKNVPNKAAIYADAQAREMVLISYGMYPFGRINILSDISETSSEAYIYLSYANVVYGKKSDHTEEGYRLSDISDLLPRLYKASKIYCNGSSEIYYQP